VELIRLEGPAASDRFEIIAVEAVIGRAPDCDVVVFDPQASRRHARLRRDGQEYVLEDLQQANPSIVNDRLVEGACQVRDGDLIVVGGVVFLVEIERPTPLIDAEAALRSPLRTEPAPRAPAPPRRLAGPILPAPSVKASEAARDTARRLDATARRLQSRAVALTRHREQEHSGQARALDVLVAAHDRLGGDEELARLAGLLRDRLANQTDIRALYRLGAETAALASWMRLARNSMATATLLAGALDLR
jgi:pSer/pThr/pTyr-binding forkhead associated (FHA) protein